MTNSGTTRLAGLDVVGSPGGLDSTTGRWAVVADGTAPIAVGSVVAGGFGVELAKSFMADEPGGRWWFALALAGGLGLITLGWWLRSRARRQVRIGITATARDPRRGLIEADRLEQQAERFSQSTCTVTMKTNVELPADSLWDQPRVEALADETMTAIRMAENLTPDATRINLIPTMPLHVAFWFGARLGQTHAREIVVHAIRQSDGAVPYFPATTLRTIDDGPGITPLTVEQSQSIEGGDPTRAALALDLQGRGKDFSTHVKEACRRDGIGHLLILGHDSKRLPEDRATYTGVVEQVCRVWQDDAPDKARTGEYAIFLSGPVAIGVALGARLAAQSRGRWTAYTFDKDNNTYEPFPFRPLAAH
ncbi:SAVED domain-containing protein [Actinoalloteichus caeruleus]|uniref:SMODS-associated and fused to various effectors domain-containing protein n=1 Tax=Actinoalloteichus caeruleus DSM 43889 TaxID=1120930 RepID=A0ABT1JGR8_ACTCY|nr:SAVED domain-containing protein [Actinoalloteichus caeruleus]MCP2331671.1 hypothetical protein [Actinoalloteichus caeruleus DSM 43889]